MKTDKGMKGYRKARKKRLLTYVIVFGLAIIAQLIARMFVTTDAARNILTVMAVLSALPAANFASPLLASWNYQQPEDDFFEEMTKYEGKAVILYELLITSKEFIMPVDAAVVHPQGIFLYCSKSNIDAKKAERFLNEMLSGHKLDENSKVIKDKKIFLNRLDNLKPMSEYEDDGSKEYAEALLKSLSM